MQKSYSVCFPHMRNLFSSFFAHAAYPNPFGDGTKTIFDIIGNVAGAALTLSIPFATIAIIVIGIQFVMASGNPTKITEAKKKFLWVLIGTALMVGASLLARVVVDYIQNPK